MIHLVEDIIAELLRNKSIGTDPINKADWPVFSDGMGDDLHQGINVQATFSPSKGRIQRTGETIFNPGFQVMVRAGKKSEASSKIREIFSMFEGIKRFELSVEERRYRIEGVHVQGTVTFVGLDSQARPVFVLNCVTTIHEV